MHIRKAMLSDIPHIMQLVKEVVPLMMSSGNQQWDHAYPNAAVFEQDISLGQLWVAEIDGEIAGISAITTAQEPEYALVDWDINETAIVTHRLAVSPAFQGRGIAAELLAQAEKEAIGRGIKTLRVDTNTANQATQRLFPKAGYVFAGEIGLGFRPGLSFFCYEKRLDR